MLWERLLGAWQGIRFRGWVGSEFSWDSNVDINIMQVSSEPKSA